MSIQVKTGAQARYQDALAKGLFQIQRCAGSGEYVFPPRELSIATDDGDLALVWVSPKGTGTVYSSTTVHRKTELGGDYNVSLIELDEGVRMMSRVIGIEPGEVRIGMRVKATIVQHGGMHLVVYETLDSVRGDA